MDSGSRGNGMRGRKENDTLEEMGQCIGSSRSCLRENEREGLLPGRSYILKVPVNLAEGQPSEVG